VLSWVTADGGGARLRIHVQPRAARSEIAGLYGEALKVRLAAPPVEGAANDELVRFLAERLGIARRRVTLEAGARARAKTVRVEGIAPAEIERRLAPGDASG
jgi:uncharacterized protein